MNVKNILFIVLSVILLTNSWSTSHIAIPNFELLPAHNIMISNHEILYRVCNEEEGSCGYVNSENDTIIPIGKYLVCYTDTLINFAIVLTKNYDLIGIDAKENVLYSVFFYDNGPDYISEGLFRIEKDGLIGYANELGEIIIQPQFSCASPFENGLAQVSFNCEKKYEDGGEHWWWESKEWFYINKEGERVKD